jgi:oxygen-independent coproporphyrinogen-3 oxidase
MKQWQPLGLYIHIPWCVTRCIYCDFNTYVNGDATLKSQYHQALLREIRASGAALNRPALKTIFFGGGTPTTMTPEQFGDLLVAVTDSFVLHPGAEITTEANPGTLTLDYLAQLRERGINRLSIGVQSFLNNELAFLSRLHNADQARQAVENARRVGFDNISLDLIFNLPGQVIDDWRDNLLAALALRPDHFSIYSLIVEPGTLLHQHITQGITPQPDDDVAAEMYELTINTLAEAGYLHYEISNWARNQGEADWATPQFAAEHNLLYWRNQPYLGVGAGAYSTISNQRWVNAKRPQDYITGVEQGDGLAMARNEQLAETIERDTELAEHMMLGLRLLREGVGHTEFAARFGTSLMVRFRQEIEWGRQNGLLEIVDAPAGSILRLTRSGRLLANQVSLKFI